MTSLFKDYRDIKGMDKFWTQMKAIKPMVLMLTVTLFVMRHFNYH